MSTISNVTDTSSLFQTQGSKETALGKDDFLKLLVAQLQNQDPMNPADPTQFTAQLAQFSQLEQLSNMSTKLDTFAGMASQVERQSALGLMGEEVVAQANTFDYASGSQTLGYRLVDPAAKVELFVLDSNGYNVATLSGGGKEPGDHFINWDGTDDNGQAVAPGTYNLVARAVDGDDNVLDSTSLVRSLVTGVEMDAKQTSLATSAGTFDMAKVDRVQGAVQ